MVRKDHSELPVHWSQRSWCVLSRSGTMGAHESGTSSHVMMLPGGREATGKTSGNCCPSDPLLQCGTFSGTLRTGQGMKIWPVSGFYFIYLIVRLEPW